MFNQFETMTLTTKKIKTLELVFVTDAYEGGTDKNLDGISEDRNLYIFEVDVDGTSVKNKMTFKNGTTVTPYAECLYSQCSLTGSL